MSDYSLERLNLIFNDDEEYYVDGFSFDDVETRFDISPNDFIKFAEHDLTAQYNHHLVNTLSNTKRAIDSQLDSLLIGFGLSERSKKWRFPQKIDFLNKIGVMSPRILTKSIRREIF